MIRLFKKLFKFHQCQRCTEKFWFNKYNTTECNFRRCPKNDTSSEAPVEFYYPANLVEEPNQEQKSEEGLAARIMTGEVFFEAASAVSEFLMDAASGVVDTINDVASIDDISKNGIGDSFD